jgi:hypothetical protein
MQAFFIGKSKYMKTIEIELSDTASSVLTEMAKRGQVKPEAIARICVENSLSQAIDRQNAVDGDEWFRESAKDVDKACLASWKDVDNPGDYAPALKCGKERLGRFGGSSITVTLDALSSKLVRWYAEENGRDIADVVNGLLAGQLGHVREEIESELTSDSLMFIAEYVSAAIRRRRLVEVRGVSVNSPEAGRSGSSQTETEKAILHLQDMLGKRFGKIRHPFGQGFSDCTLYIMHDEVNLTNDEDDCDMAEDIEAAVRELERKPKAKAA